MPLGRPRSGGGLHKTVDNEAFSRSDGGDEGKGDPKIGSREREAWVNVPLDIAIPMDDLQDAMDCSLALASQEISSQIERPTDEIREFRLLVERHEQVRALETIRRFRDENRRWGWRRALTVSRFHFSGEGGLWCLVLGVFGYLPDIRPQLIEGGILDSIRVFEGEWWRVLTATMLHRDVAHLFSNLSAGLVLFGVVMGRFGSGVGLLAILLCGVGGNLFGLAFHMDPYRGLGASGAVMGALGMLGPHSVGLMRQDWRAYRWVVSGLLGVLMLFVLFGLSPESDVIAHLGGFVVGVVFGLILGLVDEVELKRFRSTVLASIVLLGGLVFCWAKALTGE